MKSSMMKTAAFALVIVGAAAAGAQAQAATTFAVNDSAYVTKSAVDDVLAGTNLNLVGAGTGNSNDYDVFQFNTTALTGTATSVSVTLFNDPTAKYGASGSTGAQTGLVDFYLTSTVPNLAATTTSDSSTIATTPAGTNVLPTSPSIGSGGFGFGVQSSLDPSSTYVALGQVNLTTALDANASNTFTFTPSAAVASLLSGLGNSTNGLELIVTDDSTQFGTGAQNSFYGAGSGANNASFSVTTAAAPEASSLVSLAAALAILGGMKAFQVKRRTN